MSCQICGKATGPGALLCRPCKSALKRARQFTVLEMPGVPASVTMPGGLLTEAHPPAPRRRRGDVLAHWNAARPVLLFASILLALGVLAFLGQRMIHAGELPADRALPRAKAPLAVLPPAPVEAVANPERSSDLAAVPPPRAKAAPAKSQVKSPPASDAPPMRTETVMAEAPMAGAAQAAVDAPKAMPPPAAAPPVDRWQGMSDALARCAREGGFSGFFCDQRVRLDSCEGYWGQVPQCPLPPENPR